MRWKLASGAVVVAAFAAACAGGSDSTSPLRVPLPHMRATDPPAIRADKLARYMQARWPRIHVDGADANGAGTVVAFVDSPDYDYSIKDSGAYEQHVRRLTGDLSQASVELLKLSVRFFPNLQIATVSQDSQLRAFWTKEEIVAMDRPAAYRDYRSFVRLMFTAQYPPYGDPPPPPTS